jgi:hypothetical protein
MVVSIYVLYSKEKKQYSQIDKISSINQMITKTGYLL